MLTGEEIRRLRGMVQISQAVLAQRSGLQPSTLQRIERPEPSLEALRKLEEQLIREFMVQNMDYEASLREIRRANRP
jgi:transcriptional regulator with XRE-family HTH domain